MNRITIIGHLGTEPKISLPPNGNKVCRFRIASNRKYTRPDGTEAQQTEWFSCSAFGATGERCHHMLAVGRQAYIEGSISGSSYLDQAGNPRHSLNVVVHTFMALGPKEATPTTAGKAVATEIQPNGHHPSPDAAVEDYEEDPF